MEVGGGMSDKTSFNGCHRGLEKLEGNARGQVDSKFKCNCKHFGVHEILDV